MAGPRRPGRQINRFDPVLVWVAVASVAWLIVYAALTAASQIRPSLEFFVGDVLYLLPIAAATGLSVYAAGHTGGRVRVAWRLLVVSNALWLAGELTWSLYAYFSDVEPPVPSIADIGYLLQYVIALPAILIGVGIRGRLGRLRGLLDALLVATALAALGWHFVIGPLVPGSWDAAAVTTFLYPVYSVTIVNVLIAVLLSGRHRVPRSMIIAGAAYGVAAVSDAGYAYLTVLGSFTETSWLNLGWQFEAVLLCFAAVLAARGSEGDERGEEIDREGVAMLPALVAVLAVGGVTASELIRRGRLGNVTVAVTMLLFLGLLLRQFIATRDRTRLARQLRTTAITDLLTGLYNRRFFEEMVQAEASQAARQRKPLSLILLDIDHFKEVNDAYGHSAGDAVLVEAATRLRRAVRANDLISRYGGEEFMCLLPGTGEEAALKVAEHIRSVINRTPVMIPGGLASVRLTASFGVATADPVRPGATLDVDKLINLADKAVYRAKARGRNRVAGSGRFPELDRGAEKQVPSQLIWLADQIDAAIGDREHTAAVARWSLRTARSLGLDGETQRRTAAAARLHDIGKVAISRDVLVKPSGLNEQEWDLVRCHPEEGARLVAELGDRPDLAPLVAAHHERYDGRGYPSGLAGRDIPIEARVIAVCDAWSVMLTNRPYSPARTASEARAELVRGRGAHFDPEVVDTFLALVDEGKIDEAAPLTDRKPRAGSLYDLRHDESKEDESKEMADRAR